MNVQLKLNKVDYDLVNEYIEKINKEINEDKDKKLIEKLKIIDLHPWILIGTMRHYYFITTTKKLAKILLNNYLGYMNIDEDSGFRVDDKFKKYNNNSIPYWFVTYSFLSGNDFKAVNEYILNKYTPNKNVSNKKIPLISISSFKRTNTIEDIKNLEDKICNI